MISQPFENSVYNLTMDENDYHNIMLQSWQTVYRTSPPEVLLGKGVLKICSKFAWEHQCQSAVSIKLLCNFWVYTVVESLWKNKHYF